MTDEPPSADVDQEEDSDELKRTPREFELAETDRLGITGFSRLSFEPVRFPTIDLGLSKIFDGLLGAAMPTFDTTKLIVEVPTFTVPVGPIFNLPQILGLDSTIKAVLAPFREIVATAGELWRGVIPQNIATAKIKLDVEVLERLMLDEGLPLAWVPRAATLEAIFRETTPARRRAVIGRRWESVVDDCEKLLLAITSEVVSKWAVYGIKAVEGMRDGHHELAQAMSMTTLDSALQRAILPNDRRLFSARDRPQTDEMSMRNFFMFGQLWGIHRSYFPSKGDPIPRGINRHGTVHGVSRIQYSRINSVLALAHLTSLLWNLDIAYSSRRDRPA